MSKKEENTEQRERVKLFENKKVRSLWDAEQGITAKQGGSVAAAAGQKLELQTGKKVVSRLSAKNMKSIE